MSEQRKGLSRRRLLGAGAAAGFATAFGGGTRTAEAGQGRGQAAPQAAAAGEELVLTNGRIHTMERNNTVVNTVTIRNGRFAAVGGAAPRPAAGRRIIDLKGRDGRARASSTTTTTSC